MGKGNRNEKKAAKQAAAEDQETSATKIVVAVIGALATIIVAIIGYIGTRESTNAPIEATQAAEAQLTNVALTNAANILLDVATLTRSPTPELPPLTFTPTMTETPATPESDPISRGLRMECFDVTYWMPKNSIAMPKDTSNCWVLNDWYLQAQEKGIKIFTGLASKGIAYWVNTPLLRNERISFTINIKDFQTVDNYWGDFVFGFGKPSEDFLAGKFLVYRVIKSRSRIYIHFGDPNSHSITPIPYIQEYIKDSNQNVLFVVEDLSLDIYLDGERVMDPVALSANERQLFWMGYRLPQNGLLDATISDFEITGKTP